MTTKTLTIMEDAYNLLAAQKREGESFSETIRRVMSERPKKSLRNIVGMISKEEGDRILKDLAEQRVYNLKMQPRRMERLYGRG